MIHTYEKIILWLTVAILVIFLGAIVYAASLGVHLAHSGGRVDPAMLDQTSPFDQPGVTELAPGQYQAIVVARVWSFAPGEVNVPAGSTVTFQVASPDVIHGFRILGTDVNSMVIPGEISLVSHTFTEPGEYLMVCHEYCGVGHQGMYGKVIVTGVAGGDGPPAAAAPSTGGES
jgi:cytochrome c oxidase subunit 2